MAFSAAMSGLSGFISAFLARKAASSSDDRGLGREALDDRDVQPPALDDIELVADITPQGVVDLLRRPGDVAEPRGLVLDNRRGEFAGVVLAVPGRQPDQAEPFLGPSKTA